MTGERSSRIRDKQCTYVLGCLELILRQSTLCRHHLGVVHGEASARTYTCSPACQLVHRRCTMPSCGRLTGGNHPASLRAGLCYAPGQVNCWSTSRKKSSRWFLVSCGMCSRSETSERMVPAGTRCGHCGSLMLSAEPIISWETPRDLLSAKAPVLWKPVA